jgi:hypothetical protein
MNAVIKKCSPALAVTVAAVAVVLGCGGDESGLNTRYKVTGRVTYKGSPVTKGVITFEPVKPPQPDGRYASGFIENGSYSLTTSVPNDGALPGDYRVVIASNDLDTAALTKGTMLHQGDATHVKALKDSKSLVPLKYGRADSSGLKATVESRSNTLNFDLAD